MPSLPSDEASLKPILSSFKKQRHSLRISVSNLAALVGFHPYKQVPELFMQLVYQGSIGQILLQKDAELLGLSLVSPQEQLQQIARKAGASTEQALAQALTKTSDSVEAARVIKETVVREATKTGRLQATELKVLQEGVQSAVDTMHGTRHEDAALDAYEQQTGWQVRERNAQVKSWAFRKATVGQIETLEPMGEATCYYRTRQQMSEQETSTDDVPAAADEEDSDASADKNPKRPKIIDLTDDHEPVTPDIFIVTNDATIEDPPFLCLLGSIDGIRDELAPNASTEDDESWILQTIVVECKHRMNRIHKTPPLYEQIQTVAYCFMYGAEHADILQVMRQNKSPNERQVDTRTKSAINKATDKKAKASSQHDASPVFDRKQTLLTDCLLSKPDSVETKTVSESYLHQASKDERSSVTELHINEDEVVENIDMPHVDEDDSASLTEDKVKPPPLNIAVSRVSLDDPIYQHRSQWNESLLPRLRSVVDAIYNIRSDDHKRYQLLSSLATEDGSVSPISWRLIFGECPWMEHCNTAYTWDNRAPL